MLVVPVNNLFSINYDHLQDVPGVDMAVMLQICSGCPRDCVMLDIFGVDIGGFLLYIFR